MKEIVVIQEGGKPLFHYRVSGKKKLDELVSAFLSAFGAVASHVSDEQITAISFAVNKFVWVKKGDLYFIAYVSQHDSTDIYRVILQDLAASFVSTYYSELKEPLHALGKFASFSTIVESTLQKFSGIPGLARRYKTALLPMDALSRVMDGLKAVEENPDVLRGAVITTDGFIVLSHLRVYELEDVFDLLEGPANAEPTANGAHIISHPGLEKGTSFYIVTIPERAICTFVVKRGETDTDITGIARSLVDQIQSVDLKGIKKVIPSQFETTMAFYDYDVPVPLASVSKTPGEITASYPDVDDTVHLRLMQVLGLLGDETTISEIHELTGLSRGQVDEAIAYLIAKGNVKVMRLYPKLGKRDKRFSAYLEVVGISTRDYKVLDTIWNHCNGELSIKEISRLTGISVSRILDVLRKLGNEVTFM